jgi:protein TonB
MAKEVNLSSREWCDLVFEGKNKDFGAYVIRTESPKRHNKAVLWTFIGAIIFGMVTFAYVKTNQYLEERRLAQQGEQEKVFIDITENAEEPEQEQARLEQETPEQREDVLSSVRVTELQIVEDDKVRPEDEILTQDEINQTDKVFASTNVDNGQDDRARFQTAVEDVVVEKPVEKPKEVKEEIFTVVEQMPQFPGGDAALMKYLSSHINYPPMAAENNVQGKVILQFVVEKDGHIGEVVIARSVDKDLDKEATRVVKSLPKFTPGRQNGHPVRVWYTLPVNFKLQGTN